MKWRNRTAKQQAKINRERQRAKNTKRRTMKITKERGKKEALRQLETANTPKEMRAKAKEERRYVPRNLLLIRVNGKRVTPEELANLAEASMDSLKKVEILKTGDHPWQDVYIIYVKHSDNNSYYNYNTAEYIEDKTEFRVFQARPYTFFLPPMPTSEFYPVGWKELDRIGSGYLKYMLTYGHEGIEEYFEDKQRKEDALRSRVVQKVKKFREASVEPQMIAAEKATGKPIGENIQELIQSYLTPISKGYRGNLARYKQINTSLFQE